MSAVAADCRILGHGTNSLCFSWSYEVKVMQGSEKVRLFQLASVTVTFRAAVSTCCQPISLLPRVACLFVSLTVPLADVVESFAVYEAMSCKLVDVQLGPQSHNSKKDISVCLSLHDLNKLST